MIILALLQFHFLSADFNLLSCEIGNFTFTLLHQVILYRCYITLKPKEIHGTRL